MDASLARRHGYRLDGALFCAVFRGVFPAFCDEQSDGPYLTLFVAHGQHFCAAVAIDRATTETTRSDANQRKTNRTPHPVARDGSGIPILRDHISVASLGPRC